MAREARTGFRLHAATSVLPSATFGTCELPGCSCVGRPVLPRTRRRLTAAAITAALAALAALPAGSQAGNRAAAFFRPRAEVTVYDISAVRLGQSQRAIEHAVQVKVAARQRRLARELARREAAQDAAQAEAAQDQQQASALRPAPQVTAVPTGGSPEAIAQQLLAANGWASQFGCLNSIIERESGWNVHAENPGSGAYGIPQSLPGWKMGPGWQDSAWVQLRWMVGYVRAQYGSPCSAWAFWQGHGYY